MLVVITDAARAQGLTQTPAAALERLYVTHRDTVVRYLRAVSPTEDDAIETSAVVFERAFAQLGRDPTRELGLPWLLRTARNATIDQSRRRMVRRVAVTQIGLVMPTDPGPEPGYLARERDEALRAVLAGLPDETRDAIVLRYGAGLSAREIGEVIGKREEATQKLIARGLARLREVLDERP
jgi:RNA polymerase sigma-70 factor (ECF subfamily)